MMINNSEFDQAFNQVQKEYPKISRTLARSFLSRLGDKVRANASQSPKKKFGELIRSALNDSYIWDKCDRKPYAVLAGKFFGRRGGHVSHKQRDTKKKSQKNAGSTSVTVILNPNGQLAWEL